MIVVKLFDTPAETQERSFGLKTDEDGGEHLTQQSKVFGTVFLLMMFQLLCFVKYNFPYCFLFNSSLPFLPLNVTLQI
jgi:hypothetical protein